MPPATLDPPAAAPAPDAPAPAHDCHVLELRQYTLHPGRRDALIELFDREFVETQEACGMRVLGQFRDLDDGDRFVWLRGFADMAARARGLQAFYGGPVWAAHRAAANATMVDSSDVLLLRPAWPEGGAAWRPADRAGPGALVAPPGVLWAAVLPLHTSADASLLALCRGPIAATLHEAGARVLGCHVTEPSANNFPRLPVREGEPVLLVLAIFAGVDPLAAFLNGPWRSDLLPSLRSWLSGPPQVLRLAPSARSAIHA